MNHRFACKKIWTAPTTNFPAASMNWIRFEASRCRVPTAAQPINAFERTPKFWKARRRRFIPGAKEAAAQQPGQSSARPFFLRARASARSDFIRLPVDGRISM